VGHALAQPPFDAAGGDEDQLHGEGVLKWLGEQGAESVGQQIGAIGAV
jgi:hypothetical protein